MQTLSKWQRIKILLFYIAPHHWISRLAFFFGRAQSHLAIYPIKLFINTFNVDMSEAEIESPLAYPSFNAFFTRALKSDARPICEDAEAAVSPCDAIVMQIGDCTEGQIIQAKGREYTVDSILASDGSAFNNGKFCTLYLAPDSYHRVHMPLAGELETMVHVPGRLFSVAPYAADGIEALYTKNERVICIFNTEFGKMALVFVGAINVAAIETVWSGIVCPRSYAASRFDYRELESVKLDKGSECGRFNIGSTVVLLLEDSTFRWNPLYFAGEPIKMGAEIANLRASADG